MTQPAAPNILLLERGVELVEAVDDSLYTCANSNRPGGSVGRHVRHCLDFYASLLRGVPSGAVDYALRARDIDVETRRDRARARLRETIEALTSLRAAEMNRAVLVRSEEEEPWSRSTVLRELQFVRSHTVHHYALIGVLLRTLGFEPGEEFGVAPSTLRHWKNPVPERQVWKTSPC